jgi:hypothetical protein
LAPFPAEVQHDSDIPT